MENMELAYRGEAYNGMVSATYLSDGERVVLNFIDGDISTSTIEWNIEEKDGGYNLVKRDSTQPTYDLSVRKERVRLEAGNYEDAKREMIEKIVPNIKQAHLNPKEIREGLEKILLN